MASNRRFVYSSFSLEVSNVLHAKKKNSIRDGERIFAAQFGGSVRFPSGHVATFLLDGEGFMEVGKQYLLFIWKPVRTDETYVVAEPYLIQDGMTFPVKTLADVSAYEKGMPFKEFEARVKTAIAKNIDRN
jgi:hypothetical protein